MFSSKTIWKGFVALTVLLASAAFAQTTVDKTATATVTGATTLTASDTANAAFDFAGGLGVEDTDASIVLDYASNTGDVYDITVVAVDTDAAGDFWEFTPGSVGLTTAAYPQLRFVSATVTPGTVEAGDGTGGSTATELITTANAAGNTASVVTGISNAAASVTVTLGATISQQVAAGSYVADLTFEIVAQP